MYEKVIEAKKNASSKVFTCMEVGSVWGDVAGGISVDEKADPVGKIGAGVFIFHHPNLFGKDRVEEKEIHKCGHSAFILLMVVPSTT